MQSMTMPVHEQLDETTKDQLFSEVKETVAKTTIQEDQKNTFTVQDMWNRQRRAKSASDMMRRWNLS